MLESPRPASSRPSVDGRTSPYPRYVRGHRVTRASARDMPLSRQCLSASRSGLRRLDPCSTCGVGRRRHWGQLRRAGDPARSRKPKYATPSGGCAIENPGELEQPHGTDQHPRRHGLHRQRARRRGPPTRSPGHLGEPARTGGETRRSRVPDRRLQWRFVPLPSWYHNLRSRNDAEINVGPKRFHVTAKPVLPEDPDYARLWDIVNKNNSYRYRAYQEKTSRPIPVVVLTPA